MQADWFSRTTIVRQRPRCANDTMKRGVAQPTVARNHEAVVGHGKKRLIRQGILPLPDARNASPRLPPPREYRFRNQSGTGHPRAGSSTLQTIRSSDHFSKGDIILMASRMSYRSFIWSTRLLDSVDQYMRQPFSSTAFSTSSSLKTHLHKRGCR